MTTLYNDLQAGDGVEIRLVTLEGIDKTTGEIQCRLDTVRLSDALDYRALSYCWGDASNWPTIICNGHRLSATPNLVTALRSLLTRGKAENLSLTFWIDSICINQKNDEEKKVQVMLMGDIYRQALQVIVWLGPSSDSSNLAFQVCHRLWSQETEACKPSRKKSSLSTIGKDTTWGIQLEPLSHIFYDETGRFDPRGIHKFVREMDAVQDMLMRPWWSRIWIIQEVTLAKHVVVVCGDAAIDWMVLMTGIMACLARPWAEMLINFTTAHYARVLFQVRQAVMYNSEDSSRLLLHLITQCRWSKATNPRDKIYGLLGLAGIGRDHPVVRVDYSQSVESCYRTAVLDVIKETGSLDVLQLCHRPPGLNRSTEDGKLALPSWVPDLRLETSDFDLATDLSLCGSIGVQSWPGIKEAMSRHPHVRTGYFSASQRSVEDNPQVDGHKALIISGMMLDTLSEVDEMIPGIEVKNDARVMAQFEYIREVRARTHTPWKFIKATVTSLRGFAKTQYENGAEKLALISWKQLASSQNVDYPTGETRARAFSATLHRGSLGQDPEKTLAHHDAEWKRLLGKVEVFDRRFLAKSFARHSKCRRFLVSIVWDCLLFFRNEEIFLEGLARYYCFAVTKMGYFALLPHDARKGDTIALLRGGPVPFVLRRKQEDAGVPNWEVIGPCYVHGLMYGEQWNEELCQSIRLV